VTSASIAPERQHRTTAEADATLRHIGIDVVGGSCSGQRERESELQRSTGGF
jgi:hypothetical protein